MSRVMQIPGQCNSYPHNQTSRPRNMTIGDTPLASRSRSDAGKGNEIRMSCSEQCYTDQISEMAGRAARFRKGGTLNIQVSRALLWSFLVRSFVSRRLA